jgi:hypothetical protein
MPANAQFIYIFVITTMTSFSTIKKFKGLLFIITIIAACFTSSCSQQLSAPSGKARKAKMSDPYSGGFSANARGSRKAPQMGFYEKKNKESVFASAKHAVNKGFSGKDKKHKLDNDKRSTSQNYANKKQNEKGKVMRKSFIRGRIHKSGRRVKSSDNNSDSFSAPVRKSK